MARSGSNQETISGPNVAEGEVANSAPEVSGSQTGEDGFVQQPVAKNTKKGPFLRGVSDVATQREITTRDFESLGIDQTTLTFDWKDDFKIPLAGINPKAVEHLVENEYGFSIVDE